MCKSAILPQPFLMCGLFIQSENYLACPAVMVLQKRKGLLILGKGKPVGNQPVNAVKPFRKQLDDLGKFLNLVSGSQNGQFFCINFLKIDGNRLFSEG